MLDGLKLKIKPIFDAVARQGILMELNPMLEM